MSVPFLLFSLAEEHISSGLASIYNGTTPPTTMAFAAALPSTERITRVHALGLGLGFAGVVLIIGPWSIVGHADLLAQLASLGATTCYPIVGVVLGVAVLREPLTWNQPVGAVLVIGGILAAHGRRETTRHHDRLGRSQADTTTPCGYGEHLGPARERWWERRVPEGRRSALA